MAAASTVVGAAETRTAAPATYAKEGPGSDAEVAVFAAVAADGAGGAARAARGGASAEGSGSVAGKSYIF